MLKIAFLTTDNREQHQRYDMAKPYFGTAMDALLKGFAALPSEIEVHVISCTRKQMEAPAKLASNVWFHQALVPRLGWGRSAFLGCGLAVRRVLQGISPHLVHAQGTERDCGVSMMMAPSGPKLLTIHGHMARIAEITGASFPEYYWMASRLEAMALRRADGVISLTRYTKQRVEKQAARTWVVPNAVDPAFFSVSRLPEPGLILCIAGVSPWKRQIELMEAMDGLPLAQRPRLLFLGSVPDSEYGHAFRRALARREDWCEHVGHVERKDLPSFLARASLLVLPSIEDNCPMVILEAMASGVPVAASRIGGVPDLVEDGVTGALFDPYRAEEMAAAVTLILEDSELASRLGREARLVARRRFHPEVIAGDHLEIYRRMTADGSSFRPRTRLA